MVAKNVSSAHTYIRVSISDIVGAAIICLSLPTCSQQQQRPVPPKTNLKPGRNDFKQTKPNRTGPDPIRPEPIKIEPNKHKTIPTEQP